MPQTATPRSFSAGFFMNADTSPAAISAMPAQLTGFNVTALRVPRRIPVTRKYAPTATTITGRIQLRLCSPDMISPHKRNAEPHTLKGRIAPRYHLIQPDMCRTLFAL